MSLTLFVGTSYNELLAKEALKVDSSAYLINKNNFHQEHIGVCYTSVGDLDQLTDFSFLLRKADSIIYVADFIQGTNQKIKKYSERYWIEHYLYTFSLDNRKKITNCPILYSPDNINEMLKLNDCRKNNNQHLWVSGCSTSFGIGVNPHERYGNLLAEKLNLPLCMLAKSKTSIPYAADQILRSDILKNDLVIWGITEHQRTTCYNETSTLLNCTVMTTRSQLSQYIKIDLTDPTLLYESIIAIHQVRNFCYKIGARLILAGLHTTNELGPYLRDLPEYVHLSGLYGVNQDDQFLDLGDDNSHPGPLMHQMYSEQILAKLKEIT